MNSKNPKPGDQSKRGPIARPAFRPQPTPKVLQRKTVTSQPPRPEQGRRQPVAPPVYRPETQKTVQPKTPLRGNQVVQRALGGAPGGGAPPPPGPSWAARVRATIPQPQLAAQAEAQQAA